MSYLGDPVVRTLTVTVDDAPVDASTVTFTVQSPSNVQTTPAVTHTGTGSYSATFTPDAAGVWRFRWVTTGTGAGASEGSVTVAAPFTTVSTDVTPDDVADLLAQRVLTRDGNPLSTFGPDTVPSSDQVQRVIEKVTAEETMGLGTIPPTLAAGLHSLVALAAAVRILGIYFSGDAARDDLDADLDKLRERFRQAIDTIATTGDDDAVSAGDGTAGDERPPQPVWSMPSTYPPPVAPYGVPVTSLTEQF